MTDGPTVKIGVLTSGGDAQGMNAAVRAVARAGVQLGAEVYAIVEGYQGLVEGGGLIRRLGWDDVAGIQHRGGTVIGTARSARFRERAGLADAAYNLVTLGVDRLVVIGGDGSLAGADELSRLWPELLGELVAAGRLAQDQAERHPTLHITGIVGSIDNDMVGTDMTIGADSALHRILESIDAISSTAASHQRAFVIEVMGRRCGYLAMTAAIAGGCDYALIPESPPEQGWEDRMCDALRRGRERGRRESIVLVAEGARDRAGEKITVDYVRQAIEARLDEEARVTIPGHVQRGGTPSAFDRSMATMMGYAAVQDLLAPDRGRPGPQGGGSRLIGIHHNRVRVKPLMRAVTANREIATMVDEGRYDEAMAARSESFRELWDIFEAISVPDPTHVSPRPGRIGVLHVGGLAPGMNTAARAAVRLGHDHGHTMLGVLGGFRGLTEGSMRELGLADVEGWNGLGGAELGARRGVLDTRHLYGLARGIELAGIDALLVIGGFDAYESVARIVAEREAFPALHIPICVLPASIDNNLPGTELAVGADTALGVIVEAMDRVKQSAMAARRVFVIETMGRDCGYLPLMAAMSAGAEQVYIPEEGISLELLAADAARIHARFEFGRSLFVAVRGEEADTAYTSEVVAKVFEAEGRDIFDVRTNIIGHTQQGGDPSPFDRVLATRLAARCIDVLTDRMAAGRADAELVGLVKGALTTTPVSQLKELLDPSAKRPLHQWWQRLLPVVRDLADPPGPA